MIPMKKRSAFYGYILSFILAIIFILLYINHFNLTWVKSNQESVKVTINFLFPMDQKNFNQHIYISSIDQSQNHFKCDVTWLNSHIAELTIQELNEIKGQKVQLIIQNAPTTIHRINKTESIPIQFKAEPHLTEPITPILVSSTPSFLVKFNTPIDLKEIQKNLKSEVAYHIKPYNILESIYVFSPVQSLKNGNEYTVTFLKSMKAKCGVTLKRNETVVLKVDQKPSIIKTYPVSGDEWIGLYPRIQIQSKEKMIVAKANLNNLPIQGRLIDEHHALFLLDDLLKPETQYQLSFQIQVPSGEMSDWTNVHFTTTTLASKRFWLDIHTASKRIYCYEGSKCIRTLFYEAGQSIDDLLFGTYYLQSKLENYEDLIHHLGSNYCFRISEKLGIQGTLRNDYWQPITDFEKTNDFVINDDEAAWLFKKIQEKTMIIVRK